jgi:hypothetical protein
MENAAGKPPEFDKPHFLIQADGDGVMTKYPERNDV